MTYLGGNLKELIALRTIKSIIGTYEKLKTKLENAIEVLKNNQRINRDEIKELEQKNLSLNKEIEKAERFKTNIENMLK